MEVGREELSPAGADLEKLGYYLAGLIDGDGSFLVYFNRNKTKEGEERLSCVLRLKISSTNREFLEKLRKKLGMGGVYPYNSKGERNHSEAYGFYVSNFNDFQRIIKMVDGKLLLKQEELEKIKEIVSIIQKKREERGVKAPFTKEELLRIAEIRDTLQRKKRKSNYRTKEWVEKFLTKG